MPPEQCSMCGALPRHNVAGAQVHLGTMDIGVARIGTGRAHCVCILGVAYSTGRQA